VTKRKILCGCGVLETTPALSLCHAALAFHFNSDCHANLLLSVDSLSPMKFNGIFVKNVSDLVTMQPALSQFSHKSKYCMKQTTGP
jgi:hypothetical protein